MAMTQETVLIRRSSKGSITNGVEDSGEVYVTGPHFDGGVYSSTKLVSEAGQFGEEEANRLIAEGKWQHNGPHLVPLEQAEDLTT